MMMVDRLARRASEELHAAQKAAEFTVGVPRRDRLGFVGIVAVAVAAIALVIGVQVLFGGEPEEQGFVTPVGEPARAAEVIVWFTHDFDDALGQVTAADIATWEGVEYAAFWDAERAMDAFLDAYAEHAFITERAHQNPSSFPASVRIWVAADGDRFEVLERASDEHPRAVGVSLGDMDPPYEYVVVLAGVVRLGPTGVDRPVYDNPWNLSLAEVSEYESSVLGDNELTFDEYTAAVDELVECVRNRGALISEPVYSSELHQFDFSIGPYPTLEESDAASRIYDSCNAEYLDDITTAWVIQVVTPEMAQAIRDEIAACLRNQGYQISEHPTHAEVVSVLDHAAELSLQAGINALECMRSY